MKVPRDSFVIFRARVQSIDVASALLGEAISALGGGLLMDDAGVSPEQLSFILAVVALGFFTFWTPFLAFKTPKEPYPVLEEKENEVKSLQI